jgi:hypothetical protein
MRLLAGILFVIAAVLLAGCVSPGGPPPGHNVTYTPTQLKYLLFDHYNESLFFYCDPDYYPVARGNEQDKAIETFPVIENNTEEFNGIVARTGVSPPYSNESILIVYREYKKLNALPLSPRDDGTYGFTIRLETPDGGRVVTGIIRTDGVILEQHSQPAFLTCPICLAKGTLIDTPDGPVAVEDVKVGMRVWTFTGEGVRTVVTVVQTARSPVPPSHKVVIVRLSDGREVVASPGHPTADGRTLGMLGPADELDGAMVVGADYVRYDEGYTFDILPAGGTGYYRANGIPLSSTLVSNPMHGH